MAKFSVDDIVRNNIKKLVPYSSARSEFDGDAQVFLDANENSLGSISNEKYHRYPDPLQKKLKEQISAAKDIHTEKIFIGNGSDEAIDLLIRAFCNPGEDNILTTPPTYGMYEVCAAINDIAVLKVLLTDDFELDMHKIKKSINKKTKLIFICSPNNPTGNSFSTSDIKDLLEKFKGLVIVDEAYIDFSERNSLLKKLKDYPNLVILQTLSKAWALAGLRIGTAFASKQIIDILNKVKPPYNISIITQQLAIKVLSSNADVFKNVKVIRYEKEKLLHDLKEYGFVKKVYESDTNFLLVKVSNATALYNYLITKNIVVRNRSNQPLLKNCLRITIGTPDENAFLIQALNEYK